MASPALKSRVVFQPGYNSQYVYRGVDFGDDQSTLSLGASGNAGDLDWSIGLFHGSSEDATNLGGAAGASLDETRIHAGVSTGLSDCLSVSAGIINTSYNLLPADRLEVYVGAATSVSGIDVSATAYFNESDNYTGDTYYELGGEQKFRRC